MASCMYARPEREAIRKQFSRREVAGRKGCPGTRYLGLSCCLQAKRITIQRTRAAPPVMPIPMLFTVPVVRAKMQAKAADRQAGSTAGISHRKQQHNSTVKAGTAVEQRSAGKGSCQHPSTAVAGLFCTCRGMMWWRAGQSNGQEVRKEQQACVGSINHRRKPTL